MKDKRTGDIFNDPLDPYFVCDTKHTNIQNVIQNITLWHHRVMSISFKKLINTEHLGRKDFQNDKSNRKEDNEKEKKWCKEIQSEEQKKRNVRKRENRKKGQEMLFGEKEGEKQRGKENNCSRHFILSWSNKARLCFTANQRQPVHTNILILPSLLLPSAKW